MRDPALITVLLADQPGFGRTALARLVECTPGLALVATVAEPELIEAAVREMQPDVLVVDDRLVRDARSAAWRRGARLVVVGVDDDPGFPARARRIGAEAWVPKDRADSLLPVLLTGPASVSR
jgi:DNA-binding NarL/FixJ family response regulator